MEFRNCGAKIKGFTVFFADCYQDCCCSNFSNFHARVTVQTMILVLCLSLFDTWYKSAQVIIVHLKHFTQVILSPYQGISLHLIHFLRHAVAFAGEIILLD